MLHLTGFYGALTQLARVLVLHTRGHRFKSDMFHFAESRKDD